MIQLTKKLNLYKHMPRFITETTTILYERPVPARLTCTPQVGLYDVLISSSGLLPSNYFVLVTVNAFSTPLPNLLRSFSLPLIAFIMLAQVRSSRLRSLSLLNNDQFDIFSVSTLGFSCLEVQSLPIIIQANIYILTSIISIVHPS